MPEINDPELTTFAPTDDVFETFIPNLETDGSPTVPDDSSIDGLTRLGPGNIEGLRFKWTVRRVPDGYVVDETIGASISAFTTASMSRESALAFLDARETEATQRFRSLRQKFLEAQNLNAQDLDRGDLDAQHQDAKSSESAEDPYGLEIADTSTPLARKTESPEIAGGGNVDDVMDRIARLLDER